MVKTTHNSRMTILMILEKYSPILLLEDYKECGHDDNKINIEHLKALGCYIVVKKLNMLDIN
ncbi:hypothetical protein C7H19_18370 [Aphanothece hegewaldii CCALA 016]|uniref:Uncharacterized protein n=1 Tax=Aphanothece hegewaldii CCALA 016 TaxID=2107694 RepID=A0A2T1LTU5_9CHRO|nr:hypothetical protein C7H19_18370 [Aphanothece hegewaldii CCALA 016]